MIKELKHDAIDAALAKEYRQYLTGHLSRPQVHLPHIDDDIEIGISYYQQFQADAPHLHPLATEHGYVLQGEIKVRLLDTLSCDEKTYQTGDFFVIPKGTPYATKNAADTKILFIKSPGINDKQLVPPTLELQNWLAKW